MRRFWPHITRPLLEAHGCTVLVEIGAQYGDHTRLLAAFCKERGGMLHVIDPTPEFEHQEWVTDMRPFFSLHKAKSLDALPALNAYDAVFIDGDHNWYTVFHELKLIEKEATRSGRFPLVFLHDTEWPYARRDLYYYPQDIPEAFRKPHAQKGVFPGSPSLREKEGINDSLNNALEEGGEHNGVLTAVEDFLKETSFPLSVAHVPGMHGLSIIGPKETIEGSPIVRSLQTDGTLREHLRQMEEDRVQWMVQATAHHRMTLGAAVLLQQAYAQLEEQKQVAHDVSVRLEEQTKENENLLARLDLLGRDHEQLLGNYGQFLTEYRQLQQEHTRILQSRSWRYTAWLRRLLSFL